MSTVPAGAIDPRRSLFLRAALAMPLLYLLAHAWPGHWSWVFPSEQAADFYVVNGLLYFIPVAVWCLSLVLLALGSGNRIAWALVTVGAALITVYGLLFVLDDPHILDSALVFGLYVALLGAWQLTAPRRRGVRAGSLRS